MSHRILIFEQGNTSTEADVCRILGAEGEFTCERRAISPLTAEDVARSPAQAAMAVALSNEAEIVPFLKRAQSLCKTKALIAILPRTIDLRDFKRITKIID